MLPKVADKQRRVGEVDVFITETAVSHARREQEQYNESVVAQTWWNYDKTKPKTTNQTEHQSTTKQETTYNITGINPETVKWGVDRYDHSLCPGLQPGPPSQTPGGLGQRCWSVSEVTWPPKLELRRWRSSGPSSVMWMPKRAGDVLVRVCV